jgi:hypothetical protein
VTLQHVVGLIAVLTLGGVLFALIDAYLAKN